MNENAGMRRFSLSGMGLRIWGLVFLTFGTVGRAVVQNALLKLNSMGAEELLAALESSASMLQYATVAVVLQALEACAAPLFAFMLVEGFQHTSDFKAYLLRVAGLAVFCEIPFNLAAGGHWLVADTRNPVFALVICLVALHFYNNSLGKSFKDILIKLLVAGTACLWTDLLRIQDGMQLVLLVSVIWMFRERAAWRTLAGCVVACLCGLLSPFYFASPISFLLIYLYAGERGADNKWLTYSAYPLILLLCYAVSQLIR